MSRTCVLFAQMRVEFLLTRERLEAVRGSAHILPLHIMGRVDMILELGGEGEALAAAGVRALVGQLAGVGARVALQLVVLGECLAAA